MEAREAREEKAAGGPARVRFCEGRRIAGAIQARAHRGGELRRGGSLRGRQQGDATRRGALKVWTPAPLKVWPLASLKVQSNQAVKGKMPAVQQGGLEQEQGYAVEEVEETPKPTRRAALTERTEQADQNHKIKEE